MFHSHFDLAYIEDKEKLCNNWLSWVLTLRLNIILSHFRSSSFQLSHTGRQLGSAEEAKAAWFYLCRSQGSRALVPHPVFEVCKLSCLFAGRKYDDNVTESTGGRIRENTYHGKAVMHISLKTWLKLDCLGSHAPRAEKKEWKQHKAETPFCWIRVWTQQKHRDSPTRKRRLLLSEERSMRVRVSPCTCASQHHACASCRARAQLAGPVPWRGILSLEGVEVEEGRRQAHGQVGGSHLVLLHSCCDIAQEVEERLQDLPVLVRQEHDGGLDRLEALVLGHICTTPAFTTSTQWFSMYAQKETSQSK